MCTDIKSFYGLIVGGMAVAIAVTALYPAFVGGSVDSQLLLTGVALVAPGVTLKRS